MNPLSNPSTAPRYEAVDALRALAMVWMAAFHFCFDLAHFGLWPQDFRTDPVWTTQRTLILSLFLFCAGLGQAIALHQGQSLERFARRWLQIAGCALLVSLGSFFMFPRSFIYFGVLHGMAVMLLIARFTAGWGAWLWLCGLVALALPVAATHLLTGAFSELAPAFNARTLNWLGLVGRKPFTEDYVPLFPWLGVLWWGLAAGQWALHRPSGPQLLQVRLPTALQPMAVLGRCSLSFYMVHQPVLIAVVMALAWMFKP
ncbi:DUF1624 domain-containing protein [Acidovorax sp. LjRoot66]|uniref:DUF1624 domain-containing protein n=1 Tax=Acidovorax sp. LjRoot66 TaxID=3342334 RepID=UPI003ED146D1